MGLEVGEGAVSTGEGFRGAEEDTVDAADMSARKSSAVVF